MSWLKNLRRNTSAPAAETQQHTQQADQHKDRRISETTHLDETPRCNGAEAVDSVADNTTILQSFEWHSPSSPPKPSETHSQHSHYALLTRHLSNLAELGISTIWLPPGCKANNPHGNGYDCYDLWDLGEFDQKWTRSTKWGSREELTGLLTRAHELSVDCIFDAVLNHKTAGDATEESWAVEVDPDDRRVEICPPKKIEAWLRYDFPGRAREGMKYSGMRWDQTCFNGTDWDQKAQKNAIYKLIDDPATLPKPLSYQSLSNGSTVRLKTPANKRLSSATDPAVPLRRPGKGWAEDVDDLHGNYDYLLFSNIDHKNPEVKQDLLNWGKWMIDEVGLDGFRLDAAQHYSTAFCKEFVSRVQATSLSRRGKSALVVGEVWTGQVQRILRWLDAVGQGAFAYDSCLLYNFSRISEDVRTGSKNADLRTILRGCLTAVRPQQSVTFVANHDTQKGQASFVPMMPELKLLFYSFILLRTQGTPCVFWGDLYGTGGKHAEPPACLTPDGKKSLLFELVMFRKNFAYGVQTDYFDTQSCIGWTRAGTADRPGCAVVMNIGKKNVAKRMSIGMSGEVWIDLLSDQGQQQAIRIDKDGFGMFGCRGMGASVYVSQKEFDKGNWRIGFTVQYVNGI
nr:alpha-amylase [Quercus suber]